MRTLSAAWVKTRKEHYCHTCLRKFPAGTEMYAERIVDGNKAYTLYCCETCQKIIDDFPDVVDPWEGIEEGQIRDLMDEWRCETPEELYKELKKTEIKFALKYKQKIIGFLVYTQERWVFYYSEEYKKERFVAPLIDFPNIHKSYVSLDLPPFFKVRIPGWVEEGSDVEKLAKYGRKTINNPFVLEVYNV